MSKSYVITVAIVVLVAAIVLMRQSAEITNTGVERTARGESSRPTPTADPVPIEEPPRAATESITALAESGRSPFERMMDAPELAEEATALVQRWERDSVEVLSDFPDWGGPKDGSVLVLHLPAFGDEPAAEFRQLVGKHAKAHAADLSEVEMDEAIQQLQEESFWPTKPRIVLGMAGSDSDSLIVSTGSGPESIVFDEVDNSMSITGDSTDYSQVDLSVANRYSHLLGVREEE